LKSSLDSSHGGRISHRDGGYPEFGGLPGEQARIPAARRQRGHPEPPRVAPHDVQRLGADGACRAENDYVTRRARSRRYWRRFHPAIVRY
jgi:hypothetical protein